MVSPFDATVRVDLCFLFSFQMLLKVYLYRRPGQNVKSINVFLLCGLVPSEVTRLVDVPGVDLMKSLYKSLGAEANRALALFTPNAFRGSKYICVHEYGDRVFKSRDLHSQKSEPISRHSTKSHKIPPVARSKHLLKSSSTR